MIAKEDRDRYVERSVMVNMALLKKTWAEKCMTGAKLRVIRALLGVKGTYTKEELKRNFAIPTVVFSPDYSDPQVRQMMISQGMASANNMFGVTEVPVRRIEFSRDTYIDADLDNAAFQSDMVDDPADDYRTTDIIPNEAEQPVRSTPDVPQHLEPAPAQENRQQDFCCDKCGAVIAERVWNYSYDKFGRPLCMKCQKEERR